MQISQNCFVKQWFIDVKMMKVYYKAFILSRRRWKRTLWRGDLLMEKWWKYIQIYYLISFWRFVDCLPIQAETIIYQRKNH